MVKLTYLYYNFMHLGMRTIHTSQHGSQDCITKETNYDLSLQTKIIAEIWMGGALVKI